MLRASKNKMRIVISVLKPICGDAEHIHLLITLVIMNIGLLWLTHYVPLCTYADCRYGTTWCTTQVYVCCICVNVGSYINTSVVAYIYSGEPRPDRLFRRIIVNYGNLKSRMFGL